MDVTVIELTRQVQELTARVELLTRQRNDAREGRASAQRELEALREQLAVAQRAHGRAQWLCEGNGGYADRMERAFTAALEERDCLLDGAECVRLALLDLAHATASEVFDLAAEAATPTARLVAKLRENINRMSRNTDKIFDALLRAIDGQAKQLREASGARDEAVRQLRDICNAVIPQAGEEEFVCLLCNHCGDTAAHGAETRCPAGRLWNFLEGVAPARERDA